HRWRRIVTAAQMVRLNAQIRPAKARVARNFRSCPLGSNNNRFCSVIGGGVAGGSCDRDQQACREQEACYLHATRVSISNSSVIATISEILGQRRSTDLWLPLTR